MADRFQGTNGSLSQFSGNGASPARQQREGHAEDEITLQEIIDILLKWKWTIVTTFAAVFLLTAVYTFMQTPMYEASTMLYVNQQQTGPGLGDLLGLQGASSDIANEVEILQSRTIALGVAEKLLDIRYVPGTDTLLSILHQAEDAKEPLTRVDVMRRLRGRYVEVQPVGPEVDLINVFATSVYPKEAALISELYGEEYVAYNREMSRKRMVSSRKYLENITERFRDRLAGTRDTLMSFLKRKKVVAPEQEAMVLLEQLSQLQGRKYEAMLAQRVAKRQLEILRSQLKAITPEVAEELASSTEAVLGSLKEEIGRLTTKLEGLLANNPGLRENPTEKVRRLRRKIENLKREVEKRAEELVAEAMEKVGVAPAAGRRRMICP